MKKRKQIINTLLSIVGIVTSLFMLSQPLRAETNTLDSEAIAKLKSLFPTDNEKKECEKSSLCQELHLNLEKLSLSEQLIVIAGLNPEVGGLLERASMDRPGTTTTISGDNASSRTISMDSNGHPVVSDVGTFTNPMLQLASKVRAGEISSSSEDSYNLSSFPKLPGGPGGTYRADGDSTGTGASSPGQQPPAESNSNQWVECKNCAPSSGNGQGSIILPEPTEGKQVIGGVERTEGSAEAPTGEVIRSDLPPQTQSDPNRSFYSRWIEVWKYWNWETAKETLNGTGRNRGGTHQYQDPNNIRVEPSAAEKARLSSQVQNLTAAKAFALRNPGIIDPQAYENPDAPAKRAPTSAQIARAKAMMGPGGYRYTTRFEQVGGNRRPEDAVEISTSGVVSGCGVPGSHVCPE